MTDRLNGFIVILEHDIRDDDAEATINAIQQIKGIQKVIPHVANMDEVIAEQRVRLDLTKKIFDILRGDK